MNNARRIVMIYAPNTVAALCEGAKIMLSHVSNRIIGVHTYKRGNVRYFKSSEAVLNTNDGDSMNSDSMMEDNNVVVVIGDNNIRVKSLGCKWWRWGTTDDIPNTSTMTEF